MVSDLHEHVRKYGRGDPTKRKKGAPRATPQPLSLLFHEKSGFVGEKGEGKGVIMEIVHEFAASLKAGACPTLS